ncbi:low temperature requirement protein A [Geodermatophilus sabuli]|uniref:Low temperature requirement protein A n=1 Tax=Geodermatophilus sabuli TaxID=1564158 RepID=A0A7K3VV80_9ACTN|nr:low temperature requirement protein A [Geodermatophilus sabuli]NEK56502.1 low temperature requirement protein A [Geodermatophilus sabuli]
MRGRPTDEAHRVASPLELLFDLTFVVAVASITAELAHGIAAGHALEELTPFLQVFFAIWWAWMNSTWFASSYDTDDVPYRLMTMVQMAGVLVLAAGVPAAFAESDYRAVTVGYLVMRVGLVAQWVRAGLEDPDGRRTAFRYALGISVVQVGWLARLVCAETGVLPETALLPVFLGLVVLELAVPRWAERTRRTSWHPHHIAERYGLFVIILLGESVLAASTGVQAATADGAGVSRSLVTIAVSGLVLLFALWWLYFLEPAGEGLARSRHRSFLWGYGHYGIFAALAALGAGLEVAVEHTGHPVDVSATGVGYAVAIPTCAFLVLLWAVHAPIVDRPVIRPALILTAAAVVVAVPLAADVVGLPAVIAAIAVVCSLLVGTTVASRPERSTARLAGLGA